jgi:hypothetical protein
MAMYLTAECAGDAEKDTLDKSGYLGYYCNCGEVSPAQWGTSLAPFCLGLSPGGSKQEEKL